MTVMKVKLSSGGKVIFVNAPSMTEKYYAKDQFYEGLEDFIPIVSQSDELILLGDSKVLFTKTNKLGEKLFGKKIQKVFSYKHFLVN